jgi:hypothetical protein
LLRSAYVRPLQLGTLLLHSCVETSYYHSHTAPTCTTPCPALGMQGQNHTYAHSMQRALPLSTDPALPPQPFSAPSTPPPPRFGKGDKNAADQAAVDMMRKVLNDISMDGVVVIGEGEKDEVGRLGGWVGGGGGGSSSWGIRRASGQTGA